MMIRNVLVGLVSLSLISAALAIVGMPLGQNTIISSASFGHSPVWKLSSVPHPEHVIPLVFAVKQKNLEDFTRLFEQISDPASPLFGEHLSLEEVKSMTADTKASDIIENWLLESGIPATAITKTFSGDFIRATVPVRHAERLLDTKYVTMRHSESGIQAVRTKSYTLPQHVADLVDFVGYTNDLPRGEHKIRFFSENNDPEPVGMVTPELVQSFYNLPSDPLPGDATQCCFESLNQSFSQKDLDQYMEYFQLEKQTITDIRGPNNGSDCFVNPGNCGEANLDVQIILALAQEAPTTYWSFPAPGGSEYEPFLEWIVAVSNDKNPPLVHSVSYGDVESELSKDMMTRFNDEVMKLGARGVTVIVSSGDDGVGNYRVRSGTQNCGFNPSFPASAPYVTTIGATQGPEDGFPEVACTSDIGGIITTGGGFSEVFARPAYQEQFVEDYINSGIIPAGAVFNKNGRGYPDVSLLGHNWAVVVGGKWVGESGTSASAPAFASMITRVNHARLAAGKSALGFLNKILYGGVNYDVYNDVVEGENNCAAGHANPVCCPLGFNATVGWDPVTGLGSIRFDRFQEALLAL